MNGASWTKAGIIAGVLVVGSFATGIYYYLEVREDQGEPLRTLDQPKACQSVSARTLGRIRTSNPRTGEEVTPARTHCGWDQTRGQDGPGRRSTDVTVEQDPDGRHLFDLRAQTMSHLPGGYDKRVDGVGDQAKVVVSPNGSQRLVVEYLVRKGDTVVKVSHAGWDPGLVGRVHPPVNEMEAAAKAVVDDLLGKP